ncbi:MAG: ABC transporter ATP-binding protein [Chlamydiae bacterium RIFCSPHIGHO2_12_FULL_49_9]|nr:MAG: ABC transporter ATP-binding protein [Chlamydiae bacterium RIFCSPHIGHO2_12_FULL_49_9]
MILSAKNLFKSFKEPQRVEVLHDVSLSASQGESIAICGRSGEGKTTLLHILGTLEEPDSGTIEIKGKAFSSSNGAGLRNEHIGFIFQSFNLLDDFTALENVLMPARIGRLSATREKGLALLKKVGLEERADFPAKLLSGGEKQRVAIARALCNDPDLLLADEPTGNLDRASRELIAKILFDLVKIEKKTLILATHDMELAKLCTRKYSLSSGHVSLAE